MRSTLLLLTAFAVSLIHSDALGQDKAVKLEEKASTVEDVLERRTERIESANRSAVISLERIARNAVSDGDIGKAARAWEEVLKLDPKHGPATKFFETIGRQEVIRTAELRRVLVGTWKWFNGTEVTFRPGGRAVVKTIDGRVDRSSWKIDHENNEVVVPSNNGKSVARMSLQRNGRILQGKDRGKDVWGVRID